MQAAQEEPVWLEAIFKVLEYDLDAQLKPMGFTQSTADPCIHISGTGGSHRGLRGRHIDWSKINEDDIKCVHSQHVGQVCKQTYSKALSSSQYLKGTTAYEIMFKKGKPEECIGYPNDQDDRKSTSGCISIC